MLRTQTPKRRARRVAQWCRSGESQASFTDDGLAKEGGKHLDQIPASRLAKRLELLRSILRPTPHVQLAMTGMNLFAKLEYEEIHSRHCQLHVWRGPEDTAEQQAHV